MSHLLGCLKDPLPIKGNVFAPARTRQDLLQRAAILVLGRYLIDLAQQPLAQLDRF